MFETERLVLRRFDVETDHNTLLQWRNSPEYLTFQTNGPFLPASREGAKEELQRLTSKQTLPVLAVCEKPAKWPIELGHEEDYFKAHVKACGPAIGIVALLDTRFEFKNRTAEFGLGFGDPKHRGKGYGRELCQWALDFGFGELNLHRIELRVYSLNEVGIHLYRKIGFVEEGRLRKTYFKGGQWYDTILMAMLEEEWAELKKRQNGPESSKEEELIQRPIHHN